MPGEDRMIIRDKLASLSTLSYNSVRLIDRLVTLIVQDELYKNKTVDVVCSLGTLHIERDDDFNILKSEFLINPRHLGILKTENPLQKKLENQLKVKVKDIYKNYF